MENKFDRIEKLLALILVDNMKSAKQVDKIRRLSIAGFTYIEIADILDISSNSVAVELSKMRKKEKKGTPKKKIKN